MMVGDRRELFVLHKSDHRYLLYSEGYVCKNETEVKTELLLIALLQFECNLCKLSEVEQAQCF